MLYVTIKSVKSNDVLSGLVFINTSKMRAEQLAITDDDILYPNGFVLTVQYPSLATGGSIK